MSKHRITSTEPLKQLRRTLVKNHCGRCFAAFFSGGGLLSDIFGGGPGATAPLAMYKNHHWSWEFLSKILTLTFNKLWWCSGLQCAPLPLPDHALRLLCTNGNFFGSFCFIAQCQPGFDILNRQSNALRCSENRQWTGFSTECASN